MPKVYYKVVSTDLKSFIVNPHRGTSIVLDQLDEFCVQYKLNEWVKPNKPGSKLMVFDNYKDAKKFLNNERTYNYVGKLFECHAKNPSQSGFIVSIRDIKRYYSKLADLIAKKKRRSDFYRTNRKWYIPPGTVFCSAIKLVKEIQ